MTPSNPLYQFFMRVQQNMADIFSWGLVILVIGALFYGIFFAGGGEKKVTKTPSGPDTLLVADRPTPPLIRPKNVVVTDREGRSFDKELNLAGEDYGTINVEGDSTTTQIAIDIPKNRWFPDFGARTTPVQILNQSSTDVTYTPPQAPIFDWSPRPSVGIGYVEDAATLMVGASPLGIGPSNIGIYLSITQDAIIPVLDASTRILEHLEVGVGITTQRAPSVSLRYRF